MSNFAQSLARGERPAAFAQGEHGEAVLGDAERKIPFRITGPAIGARQPDREILVGPCVGLGIEEIEPAAGWKQDPSTGFMDGLRKRAVMVARNSHLFFEMC